MVQTCHIDLPALNQSLKETILRRRESSLGVVCHNQGGWHSERDILDWEESCMKALMIMVADHGPRYMELHTAWANVNETGDCNAPHVHSGGGFKLSGYYVVLGETGDTVFEPGEFHVQPMPGLLALFPSTQRHRVDPCKEQRITVAFNFA